MTKTDIIQWRQDGLDTLADPDAPPFVRGLARRVVLLADALLLLLAVE